MYFSDEAQRKIRKDKIASKTLLKTAVLLPFLDSKGLLLAVLPRSEPEGTASSKFVNKWKTVFTLTVEQDEELPVPWNGGASKPSTLKQCFTTLSRRKQLIHMAISKQ